MNNKVKCPFFSFQMNLLIFLESTGIFSVFEVLKNQRNITNFGWVFVKRLHNAHTNFSEVWSNRKKFLNIGQIHMNSEQSINLLEMKRKDRLLDYFLNIFFTNWLINFWDYYYAKSMFCTFLTCVIFFRFFLYWIDELMKFWLNQTFGWECTCHKFLIVNVGN